MRRDSHCCDGVRDRLVWSGKGEQLNTLASDDDRVKRSLILRQYDSKKSISQMVSRRPQLPRMNRWRRWYLDFRIWFGLKFLEQPPRPAHTQHDFKRYVVNIGLGQVLKMKSSPVEVAAVRVLGQFSSIPVPQIKGAWSRRGTYHNTGMHTVMTCVVMQRIPGLPIGAVYKNISTDNMQEIVRTVRGHIEKLRSFIQPTEFKGQICSFLGDYMDDAGLTAFGSVAPMTPAEFVDYVMETYIEDRPSKEFRFREVLTKANAKGLYLTHGDLHPYNVIVDRNPSNGRYYLTGIIDWTTAGWFPIYYEGHKARTISKSFWDQWITLMTGDY